MHVREATVKAEREFFRLIHSEASSETFRPGGSGRIKLGVEPQAQFSPQRGPPRFFNSKLQQQKEQKEQKEREEKAAAEAKAASRCLRKQFGVLIESFIQDPPRLLARPGL